LDPIEELCS
jgi:hypothetical protein